MRVACQVGGLPFGETREIREFLVCPPRCAAFVGRRWEKPLAEHLRVLFPDLVLHVSVDSPFRGSVETSIVPIVGRIGGEGDNGWMTPVTAQVKAVMACIVDAVDNFDAEHPARQH